MEFDSFTMVRYLIGASRIKFSILEELYKDVDPSRYKLMVMYIDAHSIFYRLYREKAIGIITTEDIPMLVRDIVIGFWNVIGHYRRFIATRLRLDNDIFVMFNRKKSAYHNELIDGYNEKVIDRYRADNKDYQVLNVVIEQAWEFICSLSPYMEGIYCLQNDGIDDFALMQRIGLDNPDYYYTIFSRNAYTFQFIKPNVSVLYGKRDNSYLVTDKNWVTDGVLHDKKSDGVSQVLLTPNMLPLAWAFVGCPDVSVKHSKHVSMMPFILRKMTTLAEAEDLFPGISFDSFLEIIKDHLNTSRMAIKADKDNLSDRYKAFSGYLSAASISKDKMLKIVAQCNDVFNENELERLNALLAEGSNDPDVLDLTNLNMSEGIRNYYN